MIRQLIPVAAAMVVFTACHNSPDYKSNSGAPAEAAHDAHSGHTAAAGEMPALEAIPENAKVYFKNIQNDALVTSPFTVEMGVDHMSVDTANGKIKPASGHHHILIGLDSVAAGTVVPKDSTHLHFGNAQTSAELKLQPGTYKLTLQFADALHRSYGSKLTSSVTMRSVATPARSRARSSPSTLT